MSTKSEAEAETMRRAAGLMRTRAEAATPGPWEALVSDSGLSYRCLDARVITVDLGDHIADVDYDGDAEGPHAQEGGDAYHIASWHPPVALAVATWLDAAALVVEVAPDRHRGMALAVARAYLGETS